jgi:hypothetical protein
MPEAVRIALFWAVMLLLALHLGLALADAAVPAITALTGLSKTKRLKVFINKFGQQASTFVLFSGLALFVLLCADLAAIWFFLPQAAPSVLGLPLPLAPFIGTVALGSIAFLTYRGLWQRLKNNKGRHAFFGILATVCIWAALYAALAILRPISLRLPPVADPQYLLPPATSLFWRLLALGVALSVALGGVFTGAWLVSRRNKDDFGRDYYNFTLRLSARIGFLGQIATLAAMAWLVLGLLPLVGELTTRLAVAVALFGTGTFLALICLAVVMPQENALRHKLMLVVALLASLAALIGLASGLTAIFLPDALAALTATPGVPPLS